ncbi:SIMPL domain-containing protein, partial [Oleiphilus sp. HI0132]
MRFISLFLFSFLVSSLCLAHDQTHSDLPFIEVSTTASAKSLPDQAIINITFSATKFEAEKARRAVDKLVRPFLSKLEEYDIQENSLDTSNTQLHPQYEYRNNQRDFKGNQITRKIEFKLNDLAQLQALIQDITRTEASHLGSIRFTLKNKQKLKRKALNKAINKAKNKAATIAQGFEVSLGKILNVKHVSNEARPAPQMRAMAMSAEMSDSQSNTYQQKEIEYNATISAVFSI